MVKEKLLEFELQQFFSFCDIIEALLGLIILKLLPLALHCRGTFLFEPSDRQSCSLL